MHAKSAHDRLQQLLRYAGARARPLGGTFVVLALFTLVSASAVVVLNGQSVESGSDAVAPGGQPIVEAPAPIATDEVKGLGPVAVHAEESRYQALAAFLARKYRVSERMIFNLVSMAHHAGRQMGVDPLLIIAVMAVESSFNPIAESIAGAKGLMQVIPKYHTDKLKGYGGEDSVFDPQTNILVGSQILKEYIARTGNLNSALQMYAGALNDMEDVYTNKVMTEKQRLQQVVNRPGTRGGVPKRPNPDATPI